MSNYEPAGQSRLTPNSTVPSNTPVSRQRPGVVIFLHGVNDPGASYASVEEGICQGLNERLDRTDLRSGRYGVDHREGKPVWVGTEPSRQLLRAKGEPRYAGGGLSAKNIAASEPMNEDESLWINGEALMPMHAPRMFGGEAVKGSPSTLGKDRGDDVTKNISLGKEKANFPWVPLPEAYAGMKEDAALAKFNSEAADENGQTRAVRTKGMFDKSLEREMTPDEARAWMRTAESQLEDNSYHSGVLRDSENHRWVTAMDVAIGQGHILDDKDWRALLTLMGDWRMEDKQIRAMRNNPKWNDLSDATRMLIEACGRYYKSGEFPASSLVNLRKPPRLVSGGNFNENPS